MKLYVILSPRKTVSSICTSARTAREHVSRLNLMCNPAIVAEYGYYSIVPFSKSFLKGVFYSDEFLKHMHK